MIAVQISLKTKVNCTNNNLLMILTYRGRLQDKKKKKKPQKNHLSGDCWLMSSLITWNIYRLHTWLTILKIFVLIYKWRLIQQGSPKSYPFILFKVILTVLCIIHYRLSVFFFIHSSNTCKLNQLYPMGHSPST